MELQELLNKTAEITNSKYSKIMFEDNDDIDTIATALEELLDEYEILQQTFSDYVKNIDENFKEVTKEEQIYG